MRRTTTTESQATSHDSGSVQRSTSGYPHPTVRIPAERLRRLVFDLLKATGCSDENADAAAEVFVEADLRGTSGQGIDYLPYMIDNLRKGNIDPVAVPRVVHEQAATALIDGGRGPGQRAAKLARDLVVDKAKQAGAAVVGVTNSTDIFMIGYYADLIAQAGLAGIVFTSGPPLVHPQGGMERMLSTNPIAFGFPTDLGFPMICDVSTSAISGWRLRQAAYYDEAIPQNGGLDAKGHPSTDPDAVKQGAISPLGGHKGYALGLSVAIMSSMLTGSETGPELAGWQAIGPIGYFGHTFIAIDPRGIRPDGDFAASVGGYIRRIKRSKLAPGQNEILAPGERAYRARRDHLESGAQVLQPTWDTIARIATELAVAMPDPLR